MAPKKLSLIITFSALCLLINMGVEASSSDRECYFCDSSFCKPNLDMSFDKQMRCDELYYPMTSKNQGRMAPPDIEWDTNDSNREEADFGGGFAVRTRNANWKATSNYKYKCVTTNRLMRENGQNRTRITRTCVLDDYADTYCANVQSNGQTTIPGYALQGCRVCDDDLCNSHPCYPDKCNSAGVLKLPGVIAIACLVAAIVFKHNM